VTEIKQQCSVGTVPGLNLADVCVCVCGLDMHRTFPDNVYFRDDRTDSETKCATLFSVLTALAHNNRQVGYCQVTVDSVALCLICLPFQLMALPHPPLQ